MRGGEGRGEGERGGDEGRGGEKGGRGEGRGEGGVRGEGRRERRGEDREGTCASAMNKILLYLLIHCLYLSCTFR